MAISDWSTSAGSNTTVDAVSIAENCPPANINNAIRSVMANVRTWYNQFSSFTFTLIGLTSADAWRSAIGAASSSDLAGSVPSGAIFWFARDTAPSGYLAADGSNVSRTVYASLFSAIGTTWGAGDGSTTFTLPDLRGEFARGWDNGRGADSGRAFASSQAAATQDLYAKIRKQGSDDLSWAEITTPSWSSTQAISGDGPRSTDTLTSGTAIGALGTGETRPRNVALLACIKV